jgi:hypothetical protein
MYLKKSVFNVKLYTCFFPHTLLNHLTYAFALKKINANIRRGRDIMLVGYLFYN